MDDLLIIITYMTLELLIYYVVRKSIIKDLEPEEFNLKNNIFFSRN